MKYKNIIFDFDGTLADTNAGILMTFKSALTKLGMEVPSDETITSTIGLPLKQTFLVACPGISDEQADLCCATYREIFHTKAMDMITLFDGVRDTLEALYKQGLNLAIASSRSMNSLVALSESNGIAPFFKGIFSGNGVARPKPAPDLAIFILNEYGFKADETLVVGDTTYDLMMGQGAGCAVCGVTWGNHKREQLEEVGPDHIIDHFSDLLTL